MIGTSQEIICITMPQVPYLRGQSVERQNALIGTSQEIICITMPQVPYLRGQSVERQNALIGTYLTRDYMYYHASGTILKRSKC